MASLTVKFVILPLYWLLNYQSDLVTWCLGAGNPWQGERREVTLVKWPFFISWVVDKTSYLRYTFAIQSAVSETQTCR